MSHVKSFADYFEVYDWLKSWSNGETPLGLDANLQEGMGAIVGAHAIYHIPTLFISRSEKRIRGIMVGWPCNPMKENEPFPSMDLKGEYFFIRHLMIAPKYQGRKDLGFGEDIMSVWPKTKAIFVFQKVEGGELLKAIWTAGEQPTGQEEPKEENQAEVSKLSEVSEKEVKTNGLI